MLEGEAQGLPVNIATLNTHQVASMLDMWPCEAAHGRPAGRSFGMAIDEGRSQPPDTSSHALVGGALKWFGALLPPP